MAVPFIRSLNRDKEGNPGTSRYIQSLADRLYKSSPPIPYRFTIHVRNDHVVNAVALPGGHILIYKGLPDKVGSENERAFVPAHEMGHYADRDHLRGLGRTVVFVAMSTLLPGPDSTVSTMMAQSLAMTELSFSRKQECRADECAVEALIRIYGHIAGAIDFFEKIPRERDPVASGHCSASHPENSRRSDHIKDIIRAEGSASGDHKLLPYKVEKSVN